MTQQTRVINNKIVWQQDNASVQQAIQANQAVAASFQAGGSAAASASLNYASVAEAARLLGLSDAQIRQLTGDTNQLAAAAGNAALAQDKVAAATSRAAQAVGAYGAYQAMANRIASLIAEGFSDAAEMQALQAQLQASLTAQSLVTAQLTMLINCLNAAQTGDPDAERIYAEYTRLYLLPLQGGLTQ